MKIRTECPKNNKYYIRIATGGYNGAVAGQPMQPYANVLDNCVGYANGRFNEIGEYGKCKYQLVCNAENFIEAAKKMGLKISPTPIEGGIMVWQKGATLSGGDGAGHVAVVERVYDDGTIMTSESGWASWAFKTVRRDNSNGRWGQSSAYKFRGCIINPAVKDPKVVPVPPLTVDGVAGACTIRALQRFLGTLQDGVLSGQNKACAKYYPAIKAVEYGKGGSTCVKKLQSWLGISADGVWGENTSKALQKRLGVTADGIFGTDSVKALQKFLNEHDKATEAPAPSTPSVKPEQDKSVYNFIDVSVWQGDIDWAKVKAAGIDGAIIRYADGNTLDTKFERNMTEAKKNGLHFGVYIFSRAKTKAEAEKEAERLYKAAKKYEPDMPYYIDLEDNALKKYADTVAAAFLNKMAALGVRGGVYANLNWWNNYLTKTAKNYSASAFWIAQYNDTMDYKPASRMGMWQYTSSGKVSGISGNVDRDKCYVAYWKKDTDPGGKEPEPEKPNTYTGEFPSIEKPKGELIGAKAYELAYKTSAADKAKYPDGKPTEAFKKALDKVYPDRKNWGAAPKVGASCDVGVGTCVRASGIDSKFPRGLSFSYLPKSDKFEEVKNAKISTLKDGDIILYERPDGGGHICIYDDGKIKEASLKKWFFRTTNSVKTRMSTKGKKWVKVFRAKGTYDGSLHKGDEGAEVKKLQKFLNWWDKSLSLAVDGIFGDKTVAAVKAFQSANGLEADGYFGAKSLAKAKEVSPRQLTWVERANAWARKIADDLYHYVTWKSKVIETHTCPICTGRKYDNYYGWNCIGFAWAVWHHGGGIPCKCNCHVISNEIGEKIAKAKTDAEALKIAQDHVGIKDIKVIRNNGKDVPKSQWKAGDIGLKFSGETYKHTFYYMGNGKVADSSNYSNDAKDIAIRAYDNYTARVIIRYIGK